MLEKVSTKDRIILGYKTLLKKQPFSVIKVTDILKESGVSHQTFYRHFGDKYELTSYALYKDAMLFINLYGKNATWKEIVISILNVIKTNPDFYRKIFAEEETQNLFIRTLMRVSLEMTGRASYEEDCILWVYILAKWSKTNFTMSVSEVYAKLVFSLPIGGILNGRDYEVVANKYGATTIDGFKTNK